MWVIVAGVLVNLNNAKTVNCEGDSLCIDYADGTMTEVKFGDYGECMTAYKTIISATGVSVEVGGTLVP